MESPFYLSDWLLPKARGVRGIPVKHHNASSPAPKVVSIPVQFVGSERSRSDSALKIQKVFRGFMVRKSLKKIAEIGREVDAIAKRISLEETVDMLRKDSKERLKMSETLMSFLFKLDSIRSVDAGVRDCRKAVIKKAIALQETIDSIVVAADKQFEVGIDAADDSDCAKIVCQDNSEEREADASQPVEEQGVGPEMEHSATSSADHCVDPVAEQRSVTELTQDTGEPEQTNSRSPNVCGEESMSPSQTGTQSGSSSALHQSLIGGCESENIENTSPKQEDKLEVGIDATDSSDCAKIVCQDNSQEREADATKPVEEQGDGLDLEHSACCSADHFVDTVAEQQSVTELTQDTGEPEQTNSRSPNVCGEESVSPSQTGSQSGSSSALHQSLIGGCESENMENTFPKQEDKQEVKISGGIARGREEESDRMYELLERMLEDNEKMRRLMSDLFERNEMQTRLLCSLSRRVEQLERAFMSGQKRKKKRTVAGAAVDCLDS